MKRKKVSIRDVAEHAGVSVGTVSRVYNGMNVDKQLSSLVRASGLQLGYVPSKPLAREGKNREKTVTIVIHKKLERFGAWTEHIVCGLFYALSACKYRVSVEFISMNAVYSISKTLQNSDACVVWGEFTEKFYSVLKRLTRNVPIVSYSREVPYQNSAAVIDRHYNSMKTLLDYLMLSNHKNFCHFTWDTEGERNMAFSKILGDCESASCSWKSIAVPKDRLSDASEGYELTTALFKSSRIKHTALIYDSAMLARGALEALKELNIRVPDEVSVACFDDICGNDSTFPALTSMKLDPMMIGEVIAENLEKMLLHEPHEKCIYIERELVKRGSSGIAK